MSNCLFHLLLLVVVLATTATAFPFYSSPYCASYASRLNSFRFRSPFYACPKRSCYSCSSSYSRFNRPNPFYTPVPISRSIPININNMNRVNFGAGVSPYMTPSMAGAIPAADMSPIGVTMDSTTPAADTNANTNAMAEDGLDGQSQLQKRQDKTSCSAMRCVVKKIQKIVYAMPACMGVSVGTCPYTRGRMQGPTGMPDTIAINNQNSVVVNTPAHPEREIIEINLPSSVVVNPTANMCGEIMVCTDAGPCEQKQSMQCGNAN
ncbi:hypothetical protein BC937DRAFT_91530 [Endogone sp. FLAS-F59071]|nr:hypothetical protein BC937DRAFT_91530 [Endogone sp. FLAS-F59071]|eukprot:RUS16181.1 hypothetical protein BC937DRAFT_91530 [Endogone sp. FLAS-F59071]